MSGKDYTITMDLEIAHEDYRVVSTLIRTISENRRDQLSLEELAKSVSLSPMRMQKLFVRWAGFSPNAFFQAVTPDHAKRLLAHDLPLLEASLKPGLSGPGHLHDLFVSHKAMSAGVYKAKGEGIDIAFGFHDCQFGRVLIMITEKDMAGMAFCDSGEEAATLEDMQNRWPRANYREKAILTAPYVTRSLDPRKWSGDRPLRVVFIGTDFEIRVWQGLLKIPPGALTTYSSLAANIGRVNAPRAVGRAVGRNPLSFVVPCHRVVAKTGGLTGYHWGLTRKRAMLGWEAGQIALK